MDSLSRHESKQWSSHRAQWHLPRPQNRETEAAAAVSGPLQKIVLELKAQLEFGVLYFMDEIAWEGETVS